MCVHFYYVQSLSVCISIILQLCSSTGYVHFHCFGRLSGLFWTVFQHCLRAFLLHFYRAPALFSVRMSTVFQHWVRAFLLICSTLCMHFYCISIAFHLFPSTCIRAHFYCVPALSACISTRFKHTVLHTVHSLLLYSGTVRVHSYYIQALFWLHLHTFVCEMFWF